MVMLMLSGPFEKHCPAKGVAELRAWCCEMFSQRLQEWI